MDEQISLSVRHHHYPISERRSEQLVNVANGVCNNQGITNGINCYSEVFKDGAWEELGLSLSDAEDIIEDVHVTRKQAEELVGNNTRR
ncbi:hypothetical protein ACFL4Z_01510 [candidate division KSB1 bacterium]